MSSDSQDRDFLRQVEARLISVAQAARQGNLTPSYVRRLLRTGLLLGVKIDRDWFTTKDAMGRYLDADRRPGPKTD